MVVIELRLEDDFLLQSFDCLIRDVVFVVELDHLDQAHQVLHQELPAHLEVVLLFFGGGGAGLRLFVYDFSSVGHDPVPEEDH